MSKIPVKIIFYLGKSKLAKDFLGESIKYFTIPPWWNTTITIYNHYEDPITNHVSWMSTIVHNCFWKINNDSVFVNQTNSSSFSLKNVVLCRIPKNDNYLNPYDWKRLDNETMKTKFTLQNGDFIVKGEVHDIVDEYTKSQRATDIKDKYKELGVMTINTISDNSDDARGIPHYMVGEING